MSVRARGRDARRTVDLVALDVNVRVVCEGSAREGVRDHLLSQWSRCLATFDEPELTLVAVCDEEPDVVAAARADGALAHPDLAALLHFLTSTITVQAINARAGTDVMLHAAALATEDGRVAAYVAPSGVGKTTIARTLGTHRGYVTDETLVIRPDLSVIAYPKPLSIAGQAPSPVKTQVGPDSLGLRVAPTDLRLDAIYLLDRRADGPVSPTTEPVEFLESIATLAQQTSFLPQLPHKLHSLAAVVEGVGGVRQLSYREAASVVGHAR